jgi:hypothetical protein
LAAPDRREIEGCPLALSANRSENRDTVGVGVFGETLRGGDRAHQAGRPDCRKGAGLRLVNATEGGARIRGFEHVPLAEVAAGWRTRLAVEDALERAGAGVDVARRRATLAAWAARTLRTLEECVRLARRCRALADAGSLADLGRAEKKLSRALRDAPLVSLAAQDEIVRAREAVRTARSMDENLAAARSLFAVVEQAGALLAEPLRNARASLG